MSDADTGKSKSKVAPPGPGKYDLPCFPNDIPSSHVGNAAKFSMGKGRTQPPRRSDAADPGKYHPNTAATTARSASWGFGSAPRTFNLGSQTKSQRTPGASLGQIDNPNFSRSPRYGFGSGERSQFTPRGAKSTPGPGQHNPDSSKTSQMRAEPSFSAAPRREETVNKKLPGPGSYTVMESQAQTWKGSPRYKFGTSVRTSAQDNKKAGTPGPGQYAVANMTRTGHNSVGDSAPKWSMPGRPTFAIAKETC